MKEEGDGMIEEGEILGEKEKDLLLVTTVFNFTPLKARNLAAAGLVSDRQNRDEKCSGCPRRFLSCIC